MKLHVQLRGTVQMNQNIKSLMQNLEIVVHYMKLYDAADKATPPLGLAALLAINYLIH